MTATFGASALDGLVFLTLPLPCGEPIKCGAFGIDAQVMTAPFQEELALHVMREVEQAVKFDAVPGGI